jgi:FkbM family methyltransferase
VTALPANVPTTFEKWLIWYARRFRFRRGKLRVVNLLWRIAVGNRSTHRLATLKHGGLKIHCDISQMLQRQYYFFGTYFMEEEILGCWEAEARQARVIFDVGANAGIYSLTALNAQPNAAVYAFEPTPELAAGLRETAALNGLRSLYVHEVAVADKSGHAVLERCRGELRTNEGMNFIRPDAAHGASESVQTVSLDEFCADQAIASIDLLKLDIQGHEAKALKGAARLLQQGSIGTVFIELNWSAVPNTVCPATESLVLLERAGYQFAKPDRPLHWRPAGDWMRAITDVIARRISQ